MFSSIPEVHPSLNTTGKIWTLRWKFLENLREIWRYQRPDWPACPQYWNLPSLPSDLITRSICSPASSPLSRVWNLILRYPLLDLANFFLSWNCLSECKNWIYVLQKRRMFAVCLRENICLKVDSMTVIGDLWKMCVKCWFYSVISKHTPSKLLFFCISVRLSFISLNELQMYIGDI